MTDHSWKQIFEIAEGIRGLHEKHEPDMRRPDVSVSQMRVMGCVFFSETGTVRLKDIAHDLSITPGGVSQIVDLLVKRGLLERTIDPLDRRAVAIRLSEKGCEIRKRADAGFDEVYRGLVDSIDGEKLSVFREVLGLILQNVRRTTDAGRDAE